MIKIVNEEVRQARKNYEVEWKEWWNSLTEEEQDAFSGGDVDMNDKKRLAVNQIKRKYCESIGIDYEEMKKSGDEAVEDYVCCWCRGKCMWCGDVASGLEETSEIIDDHTKYCIEVAGVISDDDLIDECNRIANEINDASNK